MPTYLVTDTYSPDAPGGRVMVEAGKPEGAINALIADRFTVSKGLSTAEGLRLHRSGVPFIDPVPDNTEEQAEFAEVEDPVERPAAIQFDETGQPVSTTKEALDPDALTGSADDAFLPEATAEEVRDAVDELLSGDDDDDGIPSLDGEAAE